MKKRILCLDVGDKKIGVAVSDPFEKMALGLTTLFRKNNLKDLEAIARLLQEYDSDKILIGLPLDLKNEEGPQAKKVRSFGKKIKTFLEKRGLSVAIEWFDESLSSKEAEAILLEADLSRKKRKKVIDKLAAALILQSYLNQK